MTLSRRNDRLQVDGCVGKGERTRDDAHVRFPKFQHDRSRTASVLAQPLVRSLGASVDGGAQLSKCDDVVRKCRFRTDLFGLASLGDGAIVAAGSTVTRDVGAGELRMERAEQSIKPGWADRFHDAMKRKKAAEKK